MHGISQVWEMPCFCLVRGFRCQVRFSRDGSGGRRRRFRRGRGRYRWLCRRLRRIGAYLRRWSSAGGRALADSRRLLRSTFPTFRGDRMCLYFLLMKINLLRLRQHRIIASAAFSGSFTLEIRYFFLTYTKYACEKLPFSDAKSLAESSPPIYVESPFFIFFYHSGGM